MAEKFFWLVRGRILGLCILLSMACGSPRSRLLSEGTIESCDQFQEGHGEVWACGSQLCRKKWESDGGQNNVCSIRSFRSYGGRILDSNQQEFYIRGMNSPHAWFGRDALNALPSIAGLGFNAIRVVWTVDLPVYELEIVLNNVLQNKMIPILEFHDLTGRSDPSEFLRFIDTMISRYASLLEGKEDRVILNIANEWGGNLLSHETWRDSYQEAVRRLRGAGIDHLLIIDAAGWGQDPNSILRYGKDIYEADPLQNVAFSIHTYEKWRSKYSRKYSIAENFEKFQQSGLAVIVGEFAHLHDFHLDGSATPICFNPSDPAAQEQYLAQVYKDGYRPNPSDFAIDYREIMRQAHRFKIGYIAWSWHGNGRSNECYLDYLDVAHQWDVGTGANFQPNKLSPWGCELVKNLEAQPASIFGEKGSQWSRYADLDCSDRGNFLSCDRYGGGYGGTFACGAGRKCKKSTQDINQTDWRYWCVVDP